MAEYMAHSHLTLRNAKLFSQSGFEKSLDSPISIIWELSVTHPTQHLELPNSNLSHFMVVQSNLIVAQF